MRHTASINRSMIKNIYFTFIKITPFFLNMLKLQKNPQRTQKRYFSGIIGNDCKYWVFRYYQKSTMCRDTAQKSVLYLFFCRQESGMLDIYSRQKKERIKNTMTHLEKYSEDIAKIACSGELFGVMRGDDRPISCRSAICQNCLFYTARPDPDDWCSQEERSKWSYSECWCTKNNTRPHFCGLFFV